MLFVKNWKRIWKNELVFWFYEREFEKWIGLLILWIDFEIKLVVVLIIVLDFDKDWINYEWTLIEIERD